MAMAWRLLPRQQQQRLEKWLAHYHFQSNPFAVYQADLEEYLADYFIHTAYYDEIKGTADTPRTMVVYAARGCGKSAHRIMVTRTCRPQVRDSDILAIPYTDFGSLPDQLLRDPGAFRLNQHLAEILRSGVTIFLEAIAQDCNLAKRLAPEWLSRLKWFCKQFVPAVLSATELLSTLRGLTSPAFDPDWNAFQQAWQVQRLGEMLSGNAILENPIGRCLVGLSDAQPELIDASHLSAASLFGLFVEIVQQTGIKAVYVLIDRLDEPGALAQHPDRIADFVEPLLADLLLMECKGAAFKFFLPLEIQSALATRKAIRYDRLSFREIAWDEPTMEELLSQRLIAFSGGEIAALSALCDEDLSRTIEGDICQHAQGVPRRLLQLGQRLLEAHCRQPEHALSLKRTDWEAVLAEFYGQERRILYPPLRLDLDERSAWVGTRQVALQDAPFDFLTIFYERPGRILSNAEIVRTTNLHYDNIRQMVSRIRRVIEPDPRHPVYLVTVRGRGLRLDNVLKQ
jgi:hypothetical protein